ncbi:unnamed protein product [Protopolystoma xenopodis]|uniref:Uncharacterized protein n=1 Tax=Protopolystoma xenopodis TaxID=117903 RepID=A0A3S5AKK0_9PLAT|nr:unnamed protein product [Protopolystoma xenopodis]
MNHQLVSFYQMLSVALPHLSRRHLPAFASAVAVLETGLPVLPSPSRRIRPTVFKSSATSGDVTRNSSGSARSYRPPTPESGLVLESTSDEALWPTLLKIRVTTG